MFTTNWFKKKAPAPTPTQRIDMVPPGEMDFVGGSRFVEVGDEFLEYFKDLGDLQPEHHVLDVGCGLGRLARPLTSFLNESASYEGFDIVPEGISWCQENIATRFPKFSFRLANVYNKLYNPRGECASRDYKFPYPDESFDFIFLTSVFTHMLPEELENYFAEIARVLKPGGRVFITYFLLTDESKSLIENDESAEKLTTEFGQCRIVNEEFPEASVGYEIPYLRTLYDRHSLKIRKPIIYGNWCGRSEFTSYQDFIVAEKC